MMRAEGEAPSDFQDYTLLALVAIAAHLTGGSGGERASLPALAHRYGQDLDALEQVLVAFHPPFLAQDCRSAGGRKSPTAIY